MFARVSNISIQKDRLQDMEKRLKEVTWPSTKEQKGYKGYLAMVDPKTGEGLVIALFETEADMLASEKATYYSQATNRANQAVRGTSIANVKRYPVWIKD